jgi:hypothetical protein
VVQVVAAVSENETEVVPTFREGGGYSQVALNQLNTAASQLRSRVAAWRNTRSGFFGVSWISSG